MPSGIIYFTDDDYCHNFETAWTCGREGGGLKSYQQLFSETAMVSRRDRKHARSNTNVVRSDGGTPEDLARAFLRL